MQRALPELPFDPSLSDQTIRFLSDLREIVRDLQGSQAPPTTPTNLKVTAQSFANLLQWTRSTDTDYYEVLWNTVASLNSGNPVIVNVGNSAQWTDNVGQSAITRFYWVRARKYSGLQSPEAGPQKGTTLASGTGVAPPTPPPQGQVIVTNQTNRRLEYE